MKVHRDVSVTEGCSRRCRRGLGRSCRAFTLAEMLLVVAIVTLLIGLTLPSLGRAREVARRAVCAGRLHQIGGAMNSYRLEWPRSYGLTEYTNNAITDVNDNLISLVSRVSGLDIFLCPSTRNRLSSPARLRVSPSNTTGDFSSYESYGHFDVPGVTKTPTNCKGKESRVWMVFDMDNPDVNHELSDADPHGADGANVLHADIHVRWIKGGDWWTTRFQAQRLLLP